MAFGSDEVFDALLFHQVTLCSNTLKRYELALVVDVDGVGKEVLALLLTARYRALPLRLIVSPRASVTSTLPRMWFAGSISKREALLNELVLPSSV